MFQAPSTSERFPRKIKNNEYVKVNIFWNVIPNSHTQMRINKKKK